MNDLKDLRATLDARAADVDGSLDHARRRAQVGERVVAHRRRRNRARAGVASLAALTIGAVVVVPMLGGDDVAPADRTVFGIEAPERIPAADGWTYEFDRIVEPVGGKTSVALEARHHPRLLTWATAEEGQEVRLLGSGADWASGAADFADHVVVPSGFEGRVRALVPEGQGPVALAVYDLDVDAPPPGVGDASSDFFLRDSSASFRQVGASVGDEGDLDLTVQWNGADRSLSTTTLCRGLPKGASVNLSLTDAEVPAGMSLSEAGDRGLVDSYGTCDDGGTFDPGAWPSISMDLAERGLSGRGTARLWVSVSEDDSTPLDPADAPDARIGLGLYTPATPMTKVLGMDLPAALDQSGHRWELDGTRSIRPLDEVDVSALTADGPVVVTFVQRVRKGARVSFQVSTTGAPVLSRPVLGMTGSGVSQMGSELLLPGTGSFKVDVPQGWPADVEELHVAFYRLAD